MSLVNPVFRSTLVTTYLLPAFLINVGNVAAYLFQLVIGRSMSAVDFGTFNALFSLILIATAPTGVLHLIVAHLALTGDRVDGEARAALLKSALKAGAIAGVAVLLVGIPTAMVFARTALTDPLTLIAMVSTVALAFLQPIPAGLLQARGENVGFAAVQGSIAIVRFAGGLVLVAWLGAGIAGAMWATAISLMLAFGLGLWLLRGALATPTRARPLAPLVRDAISYGWPQLTTAILTVALFNLDVAFVRLFEAGEAAGLYASGSVIGRMGLLLPGALAGIIFVEAARSRTGIKPFLLAVGLSTLLAMTVLLPVLFAPELILRLLLGERYVAAAGMLQVITAALCSMAVAQAAMMHLLGRRQFGFMLVLAAAVAAFVTVALLIRPGAMGMAWLLLTISLSVLCGCMVLGFLAASREAADGLQPLGDA